MKSKEYNPPFQCRRPYRVCLSKSPHLAISSYIQPPMLSLSSSSSSLLRNNSFKMSFASSLSTYPMPELVNVFGTSSVKQQNKLSSWSLAFPYFWVHCKNHTFRRIKTKRSVICLLHNNTPTSRQFATKIPLQRSETSQNFWPPKSHASEKRDAKNASLDFWSKLWKHQKNLKDDFPFQRSNCGCSQLHKAHPKKKIQTEKHRKLRKRSQLKNIKGKASGANTWMIFQDRFQVQFWIYRNLWFHPPPLLWPMVSWE